MHENFKYRVDVVGIYSNSANTTSDSRMTLPNSGEMDIDDFHGGSVDNYNDVGGRTMYSNKTSRTVSMSSSEASVDYATRME